MKTLDPLAGLSAFLAVAESLNFSKAAETLGMSRATVSAQLQQLEQRLGMRLLQRNTRNVVLTEAGAAYRQALTGILPQIREAERAALSFQQEAIGRLRISAPPDLAQDHLVRFAAEFLIANPAISIEMDLSHGAVNLVEQGFDLAIRGTLSVEPNLITRKIGTSPIVICAAPTYLEEHGEPQHPEEITRHACLHFAPLRWGRVWPFQQGETAIRVPIIPRFEINDGISLREAARAGAGIALLPSFIVGSELRDGRLRQVLPEWTIAAIPIHAVYPANRHIAAKVRRFVGFLAERLANTPDFREA